MVNSLMNAVSGEHRFRQPNVFAVDCRKKYRLMTNQNKQRFETIRSQTLSADFRLPIVRTDDFS